MSVNRKFRAFRKHRKMNIRILKNYFYCPVLYVIQMVYGYISCIYDSNPIYTRILTKIVEIAYQTDFLDPSSGFKLFIYVFYYCNQM